MTIEQQIKDIIGAQDATIEIPKSSEHGEYSSNIAMKNAKKLKRNPRELALELVNNMDFNGTYIARAEVAGGGFINFFPTDEWYKSIPLNVLETKENWGSNTTLNDNKICLEYVSANPTGPMHMGNARGGALGDSLARILSFCGAEVVKEFYLNDAGSQIEKFKQSLEARFDQLKGINIEFKDEWYQGDDIVGHAQYWLDSGHETSEGLMEYALEKNITDIKRILESYNVEYDVWFRESTLYNSDSIEKAIKRLGENNKTYNKDGALWLKTEGDDVKDEVLVRANSFPTYFAADIAYHYNKFEERGFTRGINIWGADHGGHVSRMKSSLESMGIDSNRLEIIIIQLVRLIRDKQVVRMSKRKGDTVSLEDLIEEIGVDSARFFFNMRNATSAFDFDLDLAIKQSNENPVFYVQYAHARICSLLELAGVNINEQTPIILKSSEIKYNFDTPSERTLIKTIALFPREIVAISQSLEPSSLTTYVRNLASDFHSFYTDCPVNKCEDEDIRSARLILVQATRQTIKNALDLLGVSAPTKMAKIAETT